MDKDGNLYDKDDGLLMLDFGYSYDGVNCKRIIDLLNELAEENQSLKEENKFLQNKIATYKSGNALLKKTLDKEWK
jgi:hypothetical protein